ncbi:MAG: hypothetical protein J6S60_00185 [Oscillospiraceae bacterium]|nr:hypothetical protein [Oscillospiraceae bacterium]
MGVYIKGLHKAKHCIDCPLMMCNADGDWCALQDEETNESFKNWDDMRKHCPLVEVKAPHGRLGDLDALRAEIIRTYEYEFPTATGAFDEFVTRILPNVINNAPTIIEAEGKDDG